MAEARDFRARASGLEGEAQRVLTDRDQVAVRELLFNHRLAVDQRAVGAAEGSDPEGAGPYLDPAVMPRGCGIAHDHVVVWRAADAHHPVWQGIDAGGERSPFQ